MIRKLVIAIILTVLLFNLIDAKTLQKGYDLNLTFSDDSFYLNSIIANPSISMDRIMESGGDYHLEIISLDNKSLARAYFSVPEILREDFDPVTGEAIGSSIIKNNTSFIIQVPYYENAREIKIYDFYGFEMISIPVSQFSKNLCGDGICQTWEVEKCPVDCKKAELPTIPEEKKYAEKSLVEKAESALADPLVWGIIIAALVLIALIIVILKKKKQKSPYEFI